MRNRQAFKNMMSSIILQIITAISGIILPRLFLGAYGSSINGMVSSVNQFIEYLSLVEAGVGTVSMVALYSPIAEKSEAGINRVMAATKQFYFRSGCIFLVLVLGLVGAYPFFINKQLDSGLVRLMVLILASSTAVDYLFLGKYRVLLMADQKGYIVTNIQTIGTILNLSITAALIQTGAGVLMVKFVATAVFMLRLVFVYVYVRRHYKFLDFHVAPDYGALSQRWDALWHKLTLLIVNSTDIALLTICLGSGSLLEVSVYAVYNMVGSSLTMLLGSFSDGLRPGFGEIISKNEKEVLKHSYSNFEYMFDIIVFWCYTCMGVLILPFITVYTLGIQDVNYIRPTVAVLFTAVGLLQNIRIPGLTIIYASGHFSQTRNRAFLEAFINLGISLLLVKQLGIVGVLIGTLCSYAYRSFDIIVYNAKYLVEDSLKKSIYRLMRNVFVTLLLIYGGIKLVPQQAGGFAEWFLFAILTAAVSLICFIGINAAAEPAEFGILWKRFKNVIHRN